MTYITYITYMTYMTYMTYITYIIYITYVTDSTYSTYMTYRTYSTYITAHSCCQRSLTPIQAHALPSACRAESCLLCCQPEPSLSHYLPDYHELFHDSLADCKLKGDELST